MTQPTLPRALSVELHLRQPGLDVRAQFRALPGRVCAIVGRQGSGKSALLKAAAGLAPALTGRVALGPDVLYDTSARINLPPHVRRLSWLDAQAHVFPHLNVRDNLLYGRRALGRWWSATGGADVGAVARWAGLQSVLHLKADALGPTQRVRVALARALAAHPHALLLDDVLGGVPDHEREPLLALLAEVPSRFKLPVVLVTPRMDEVIRMADDVVILHEGRMASAGPVAQILSDVSLSTFLEGVHAGSVLEGEVTRHDIEWLLSEVDVGGQCVTVSAMLHGVGSKVRLKVRARDISLHRELPGDTSASNHLRGRITQVMLAGEHGTYGAVGVELARELDAANLHVKPGATLWALLTRKAIQQMAWAPGQPCIVGFKAMATAVSPWR
ncbi:ATP-binding cassette domain-containing protein [Aquabacterium sp.]|uniref:ATP-binding cassette domain-containing protein n=1 Tax=Aquabacterium sp. TaxID=1872578 RepID=UPI001D700E48|nr:ATP-binding cassette domain-containing protein [Aquabacterium sp.]MBT9611368.1 ATP-binding cassette domain-containing protein [Aquabacterium sp.]